MRMAELNERMFGGVEQPSCRRMPRDGMCERTMGGRGFQTKGTMRIRRTLHCLAAFALFLSATSVSAGAVRAPGEKAIEARAILQFRINIPETLHLRSGIEHNASSRSFTSRTTHTEHDRTVITVAKP